MANIKILDCTLRDGGYVNAFQFDNRHIESMIQKLQSSHIDVIECGFLDNITGKENNSTRFKDISFINNLIPDLNNISKNSILHVAMMEYGKFNIENLPDIDNNSRKIAGIRFSFRKSDYRNIFDDVRKIVVKGYKLFIQPIATELYSDAEILDLIEKCNTIGAYAVYIVDTHGSMMRDDFRRLYYLFEHNLNPSISLGFHSHNNLQLSYSHAIDFIDLSKYSKREIIIDSSVYGMGRGAGNLNTELLADYINKHIEKRYDVVPLLDIVDEYLSSIKNKYDWGYSLEHFLSATEHCHPNYASYLINLKNLSVIEIRKLLEQIPFEERREFNKELIHTLYINYKETIRLAPKELPSTFFEKKILLIASGKSIEYYQDAIVKKIKNNDLVAVGLNHINHIIPHNYTIFTNQARYNEFCEEVDASSLIVSSNIKVRSNHLGCFVLDYRKMYEMDNIKVDNVAILTLNYLREHHVKDVYIAGLDGYDPDHTDSQYSYREYNQTFDTNRLKEMNSNLSKALSFISQDIHITFLTPSRFKKDIKQKIIGVIPSRFASTRLPGKPLKDIAGLPMIIHVLKRAQMAEILDEVIVATDDQKIYDTVVKYGGKCMMTSPKHNNGTERMHEVSQHIAGDIFVVINGDEALLNPKHIEVGVKALMSSKAPVSLLYNKFTKTNSPADFKVVINNKSEIMYISRNDIPSDARLDVPYRYKAYHIMSFTKEFLDRYITFNQTPLDRYESHELLRVLEYDYKIQGVEVDSSAISVDTQEDLEYVQSVMPDDPIFKRYKNTVLAND